MVITEGHIHESTLAESLLLDAHAQAYLADKAFDSNAIRYLIETKHAQAVIPCNRSRKVLFDLDTHLYKERHAVENFFLRIKRFRKVATRYAKLLVMYQAAVYLAAIVDWLQ